MADDFRLCSPEGGSSRRRCSVPYFLITPPRQRFRGGAGPLRLLGAVVDAYEPVMTEDDFVVNRVQALDADPAPVCYVVRSHPHEFEKAPEYYA